MDRFGQRTIVRSKMSVLNKSCAVFAVQKWVKPKGNNHNDSQVFQALASASNNEVLIRNDALKAAFAMSYSAIDV